MRKSGALIRLTTQILAQQRLRVFAIADKARKSIISHSMLLGSEPINSKWSTDVRFGAHSGLKADMTALRKVPTAEVARFSITSYISQAFWRIYCARPEAGNIGSSSAAHSIDPDGPGPDRLKSRLRGGQAGAGRPTRARTQKCRGACRYHAGACTFLAPANAHPRQLGRPDRTTGAALCLDRSGSGIGDRRTGLGKIDAASCRQSLAAEWLGQSGLLCSDRQTWL